MPKFTGGLRPHRNESVVAFEPEDPKLDELRTAGRFTELQINAIDLILKKGAAVAVTTSFKRGEERIVSLRARPLKK